MSFYYKFIKGLDIYMVCPQKGKKILNLDKNNIKIKYNKS